MAVLQPCQFINSLFLFFHYICLPHETGSYSFRLSVEQLFAFSQKPARNQAIYLDVSPILRICVIGTNTDIFPLITNHPGGIILGYNRKELMGNEECNKLYNYPDTVFFSFVLSEYER